MAKAIAGYKEINLRALDSSRRAGLSSPAAVPITSSEGDFCRSPRVGRRPHARADISVEKRMQGRDHPVLMTVPETFYLKCFILRKLG